MTTQSKFMEGKIMRDSRIFANNEVISNDTWKTQLNNNDLIIGGTGRGKTRYYIKPNIERAENESIVVADTKGNLYGLYKDMLKAKGYKVINIDFKNIRDTEVGYNPIDYIRRDASGKYYDQDIVKLGNLLCPVNLNSDPFWDYSAQNFINCAIASMFETVEEENFNMNTVFEYASKLVSLDFAQLIDLIREEKGKFSYAVKCFRQVEETKASEKTISSILSVMRNHIALFESGDVMKFFMHDNKLKFENLGEEKTALFLTISDSDRSMDRLINMMYANMFDALIQHADNQPGERLKVPVHFYMDDFATNTRIPDFDNLISVIRSREISVSLVIQSIGQLKKSYPDGALTIISNCDHILFLGADDPDTTQYIGSRIGKMRTTVSNLPREKAILIESGRPYKQVLKCANSGAAVEVSEKYNKKYRDVVNL